MKCPHCDVAFHEWWSEHQMVMNQGVIPWLYRTTRCPACNENIIAYKRQGTQWRLLFPRGATRGPFPTDVPPEFQQDYTEAAEVLPISAKASAALSRRCLQHVLDKEGYSGRDLSKQIDAFLAEDNADKIAPRSVRDVVDLVRNFGNFSAHRITDRTTLQLIDVEPHEAEQCLDVIDALFDFFYVQPAETARRRDALNAKLAAGGKPPAKGG